MFTEGTRSKGKGLQLGKTGAARLAINVNCAVITMAVMGTQNLFNKPIQRTPVRIEFGSPIYPQKNEKPLDLTNRVMFEIAKMLPEDLRGVYAGQVW